MAMQSEGRKGRFCASVFGLGEIKKGK